jgi:hypothetical protein
MDGHSPSRSRGSESVDEALFHFVMIPLTDKEYRALYQEAILEPSLQNLMRTKLGLPGEPYGYKKYCKEMQENSDLREVNGG